MKCSMRIDLKYSYHTTCKVTGTLIWLWWSFHAVSWISCTTEIRTVFTLQLWLDKSSGVTDRMGSVEKRTWLRKVICLAQVGWGSGEPSVSLRHCDTGLEHRFTDGANTPILCTAGVNSLGIFQGSWRKGTASWTLTVLQAGYALALVACLHLSCRQALLTLLPWWFLLWE